MRQSLSLKEFIEKVADCRRRGNYRLFAWEVGGQYVACCGVMPMPTLYYTDCLWVAELVVMEKVRGQGIGGQLLATVEKWAKEQGYQEMALSSGIQRKAAHRFYQEKAAYHLVSYQFQKKISD
nr:GNAT family N-acetyltransferase [Vagococcus allomyrinae]